jgi:hypothetical protein
MRQEAHEPLLSREGEEKKGGASFLSLSHEAGEKGSAAALAADGK